MNQEEKQPFGEGNGDTNFFDKHQGGAIERAQQSTDRIWADYGGHLRRPDAVRGHTGRQKQTRARRYGGSIEADR